MSYRLCNAPIAFQKCILSMFMVEKYLEVFMDDFSIVGGLFYEFVNLLRKVLQ